MALGDLRSWGRGRNGKPSRSFKMQASSRRKLGRGGNHPRWRVEVASFSLLLGKGRRGLDTAHGLRQMAKIYSES